MRHPNQSTLALYAGQDLGWFARRRTERHLARCRECRDEVRAFVSARDTMIALNELPAISWSRLAIEMRANIRLGLEAGECVRGERTAGLLAPFGMLSSARTMTAWASVMALVAAGLFLQRPTPMAPPAVASDGAVLRATATGIELNQGGQTLSLLGGHSADVTYSAGAQGSMRAGYVDSDTGNMTINNVYVQ
jgi:anti-sigma-K factor RskA